MEGCATVRFTVKYTGPSVAVTEGTIGWLKMFPFDVITKTYLP
jgi:hypothetical protein